ncbi:hypothetical protein K7432_004192 [Basidiobolus ranarum]|uniref:KxDL domain-containing protein n=1 Tax=Basidiobolus ranarum TaxID=34480 RepID=A0ABR2W502_9FUNG
MSSPPKESFEPDYFQLAPKAISDNSDNHFFKELDTREELQKVDDSERFVERCIDLVSPEMIDMMLQFQNETSQVLITRTEELAIFNEFSQSKYQELLGRFQKHTQVLINLRTDLELVFRRIRALKSRIGQLYPEELSKVVSERPLPEE